MSRYFSGYSKSPARDDLGKHGQAGDRPGPVGPLLGEADGDYHRRTSALAKAVLEAAYELLEHLEVDSPPSKAEVEAEASWPEDD